MRPPNVVVFHTAGDATKSEAIRAAMQRAAKASPGALTSSYFSTGSLHVRLERPAHDVHGDLPAGPAKFDTKSGAAATRKAAAAGLPAGITVHVTGHDPLEEASTHGSSGGPSVLLEARDRRPRRARHPALRLRDAAGGADADRRRGRGDPEHVHARSGA